MNNDSTTEQPIPSDFREWAEGAKKYLKDEDLMIAYTSGAFDSYRHLHPLPPSPVGEAGDINKWVEAKIESYGYGIPKNGQPYYKNGAVDAFAHFGSLLEQERKNHNYTRISWDRTTEERDKLRAQLSANPSRAGETEDEKRIVAISFVIWAAEKGWLLHPDQDEEEEYGFYKPSDDFDIPDERLFGGQLYDLYLQHLNHSK